VRVGLEATVVQEALEVAERVGIRLRSRMTVLEPLLTGGTQAALKSGMAGGGGADGNGKSTGAGAGSAGQSATVLQL
jgi:hypothetical protein